ncbi:MAG: hypothetical protein ACEPOZ_04575 [Marinifilaceae bacterium]
MPYRRLPNTDSARVRAMKSALAMCKKLDRRSLAFSMVTLQKLEFFLPRFEMAISNQRKALASQAAKNKKFTELGRKARLYISHFIQVLNFSIIRGELKPEVREFYGIDIKDKAVPSLINDSDVLKWGEQVIKGEQERTMRGGNPIYSPSIALVRVNYENFKQASNFQKTLQNNTHRFSESVAQLRKEADKIILHIWNEVEESFSGYSDDLRRERCQEYGLVYVYRKGERERLQKKKEAEKDTMKLPFASAVEEENQVTR